MEHQLLFEYIKRQDSEGAEMMMKQHLKGVIEFAKEISPKDKTI